MRIRTRRHRVALSRQFVYVYVIINDFLLYLEYINTYSYYVSWFMGKTLRYVLPLIKFYEVDFSLLAIVDVSNTRFA